VDHSSTLRSDNSSNIYWFYGFMYRHVAPPGLIWILWDIPVYRHFAPPGLIRILWDIPVYRHCAPTELDIAP
jgi:hypothetical protein